MSRGLIIIRFASDEKMPKGRKMKVIETPKPFTDKLAIGLSIMCTFHCLALPSLLVLLPTLATLQLDNEWFHIAMVIAVIPISLFALTLGCKKHGRFGLLLLGGIGLALLLTALLLGEALLGHSGEKVLTVIGSIFVALGHWFNYRLCRESASEPCPCPETSEGQ